MELQLDNCGYIVSHLDKKVDQIEKNKKSKNSDTKRLGDDAELLLLFKKTLPSEMQAKIIMLMIEKTNEHEFALKFSDHFFRIPILDHLESYQACSILQKICNNDIPFVFNNNLRREDKINICKNHGLDINNANTIIRNHTEKKIYTKKELESLNNISKIFSCTNKRFTEAVLPYNYRTAYTFSQIYNQLGLEALLLIPLSSYFFGWHIITNYCSTMVQPKVVNDNMIRNAINEFLHQKYQTTNNPLWLQYGKRIKDIYDYSTLDYLKAASPTLIFPFIWGIFHFKNESKLDCLMITITSFMINAITTTLFWIVVDIISKEDWENHRAHCHVFTATLSVIIILLQLKRITKINIENNCRFYKIDQILLNKDIVITDSPLPQF